MQRAQEKETRALEAQQAAEAAARRNDSSAKSQAEWEDANASYERLHRAALTEADALIRCEAEIDDAREQLHQAERALEQARFELGERSAEADRLSSEVQILELRGQAVTNAEGVLANTGASSYSALAENSDLSMEAARAATKSAEARLAALQGMTDMAHDARAETAASESSSQRLRRLMQR
jgi:hypothetical protein